ncbi:MAG: hypothetical protein NTV92_06210 [Candidatus Bipolaricaulota bacterium]|nr:hypothetical protein [Candidatus Bipolaricaulota bacterium]
MRSVCVACADWYDPAAERRHSHAGIWYAVVDYFRTGRYVRE